MDPEDEEDLEKTLDQIQTGLCGCYQGERDVHLDPPKEGIPASKTLLHLAVTVNLQITHYLLNKGCDVNKPTNCYAFTPLHLAVISGKKDIVQLLLCQPNLNINVQAGDNWLTPLQEACINDEQEMVALLIASPEVDLDMSNRLEQTPLISAVTENNIEIVEQLLEAGADPDACDLTHRTALMEACCQDDCRVLQALIDHDADLHYCSRGDHSALMEAVAQGNAAAVTLLLEAGVDMEDKVGEHTALSKAVEENKAQIVSLLLDRGANASYCNDGATLAHTAATNNNEDIITMLFQAGAPMDERDDSANTPLSQALFSKCQTASLKLLELDCCNVNNVDDDGDTPLIYAAYHNNLALVRLLLEKGADPRMRNRLNTSPLWYAVYNGNVAMVTLLAQHNVDVSVESSGVSQNTSYSGHQNTLFADPRSPLWVAAHGGHGDLVTLLVGLGCQLTSQAWIGDREFPGKSAQDPAIQEQLTLFYSSPLPLTFLCRCLLRPLAGPRVDRFVQQLPVPQTIKTFLCASIDTPQ